MENATPPITLEPPTHKKQGCGCFGIGCIVVLALMLIGGGIGLYTGYQLMEYAKSFTSEQGVEIAIVDGTDEEYAAIREKIEAYERAFNAGQSAAMQLTAREINILIARDPDLAEARGRVSVSMEGGVIGAQVSLPLNKVGLLNSVPQFKDRYFNGDVKGRFQIVDGKASLSLDEARAGERVAPAAFLRQLNDEWTRSLNTDPDFQADLSRIKKVEVQGDVLMIEAKASEAAEPAATASPDAPVEATPEGA